MIWIEVTAIATETCGSVTNFKPIATSQTYYSVVEIRLNPEKIGRETILVSKEAHFFID